jgi:uncharacterized protein (TIGR02246 family)
VSTADLEAQVRALEDVEAIKKLKARYCAQCDDNFNAEGIAALFTEDGVFDAGAFGKPEGREAIRNHFIKAAPALPFAIHMVMNPNIEVRGDSATGVWYLIQPCTFADGNQAVWGSARYDDQYVRVGGEWKFKHVKLTNFFWTPFDQGWVKKQFVL